MSSISGIGSTQAMAANTLRRHGRPDPEQMAGKLFARLDSKQQGYIEQADLAAAFGRIDGSSSSDAEAVFTRLDGNSDGKLTRDEFSSGLRQLAEQLDSQFAALRADSPPPPPPAESGDTGFSLNDLRDQLTRIGSSDDRRSQLLTAIVDNFSAADANGDGRVNAGEAMAFGRQRQTTASNDGTTSATGTATNDLQVMLKIAELLRTYGHGDAVTAGSTLTASA